MVRLSIQIKILTGIVLVLLLSVSFSIVISVANQRTALLENSQRSIRSTNEILNTVIRNIMLDGEAPLAVSTLEGLQQVPGIEYLQIFRRDGSPAFSDYETLDFVNSYQSFMMFDRTPRQDVDPASAEGFMRSVISSTPQVVENLGARQLEFFFPIINTADCRVCHGDDHLVRGVAYYRISLERVFEQIGRSRNTLILFFLATGSVIALVLFGLMRKVVISPVQLLGAVVQTVGQGNLDVSAQVNTRDEFGLLSRQINTMIAGLKEKNRLEVENRVIETRNRENQKYLDTIGEGLLLIGRDRKISSQYSRYLTELFERQDVEGHSLAQFLFPREPEGSQARQEIDDFIDVIFKSLTTEMDMIMSINPLANRELETLGGKRIIVDCSFFRIMEGDQVENVMVIFTDRTGIVQAREELEREKQRSEAELSQIAAILRIGPESFDEFIEEAERVRAKLATAPQAQSEEFTALLRDLHSLKGSSRYLGFSAIGDLIHEIEDRLHSDTESEYSGLSDRLEEGLNAITEVQHRFARFALRSGAGPGSGGGRPGPGKGLSEAGVSPGASSSPDSAAPVREGNLLEFRRAMERMLTEAAAALDKKVRVSVRGNIRQLPMLSRLRPALIHLGRNALDHGIEERFERIAAGKGDEGQIEFIFTRKEGQYKLIVADDGQGIDFAAVARRGRQLGLLSDADALDTPGSESSGPDTFEPDSRTRTRLIQLLFSPRFSTRQEAGELSGRGVGLSAVQQLVTELGGRISVYTEAGKGTHFTILLPAAGEEQ